MTGTLICETVTATRMAELRARRDQVADADMVELRMDGVRDVDIAGALEGRTRPVVVTCRPAWEGGRFTGSEEERLRLLGTALKLGAEYVDVEWKADRSGFRVADRSRLVLSMHDFAGTPGDLADRVRSMRREHPATIKVAVMARTLADCVSLRDACREAAPHVAIAMGEKGLISRVCPARFGSQWTYAGCAEPGQLPASLLADTFRVKTSTTATDLFALAGRPEQAWVSLSMHNAAFKDVGVNAVSVPLDTDDASELDRVARAFGLLGASVTAALGRKLVSRLPLQSELARRVGVVDTIRATPAGFEGDNFQITSFLVPLDRRSYRPRGARVRVLGAGSLARAAAFALKAHGSHVMLSSPAEDDARAAARDLAVTFAAWPPAGDAELVVGALAPDVFEDLGEDGLRAALQGAVLVYDLASDATATPLTTMGRRVGATTIAGTEMRIAQARRQLQWWTNREASVAVLERAAAEGRPRFASQGSIRS